MDKLFQKKPSPKATKDIGNLSRSLKEAFTRAGVATSRPWSESAWATELSKLSQKCDDLTAVIKWICDNYKSRKLYRMFQSPAGLRKKWDEVLWAFQHSTASHFSIPANCGISLRLIDDLVEKTKKQIPHLMTKDSDLKYAAYEYLLLCDWLVDKLHARRQALSKAGKSQVEANIVIPMFIDLIEDRYSEPFISNVLYWQDKAAGWNGRLAESPYNISMENKIKIRFPLIAMSKTTRVGNEWPTLCAIALSAVLGGSDEDT